MWPGFDFLSLFLATIFNRGIGEFLLLVGVLFQGLFPTTGKRIINCYGYDKDQNLFWQNHPLETILCPHWQRPKTSCLDDCGMPSGHSNVAIFYFILICLWARKWLKFLNYHNKSIFTGTVTSSNGGQVPHSEYHDMNCEFKVYKSGDSNWAPKIRDANGNAVRAPSYVFNLQKERWRAFIIVVVLLFLIVQPAVIVSVGDHTILQAIVGSTSGGITGWIFYYYIITDERIDLFLASTPGRWMNFHDNFTLRTTVK